MRWAGNVTHMEENRNAHRVLVRKTEGKRHVEDLGIDGSLIQGDQKVSVHVKITIQKVTSNVQSVPR
jgi:hypothetical protein